MASTGSVNGAVRLIETRLSLLVDLALDGAAQRVGTDVRRVQVDPPTILRRPGAPIVERPHDHPHHGHDGVTTAPVTSARTQGGT